MHAHFTNAPFLVYVIRLDIVGANERDVRAGSSSRLYASCVQPKYRRGPECGFHLSTLS